MKDQGIPKGRTLLYSLNAKILKKCVIYHHIAEVLEEGKVISQIAKEVNITRQIVYRIKHDKENYLDKLMFNVNERFSQSLKSHIILLN